MSEITNSQIERLISLERINNNQATQIGAQQKHIDILMAENTKLKSDLEKGSKEVRLIKDISSSRKCYNCNYVWKSNIIYCPNCGTYIAKPNMYGDTSIIYNNIDDGSLKEIIQTEEYKILANEKKGLEHVIELSQEQIKTLNKDHEEEHDRYLKDLQNQKDKEKERIERLKTDYTEQIDKLEQEIEDLKLNIVDELTEEERKNELTDLRTTIEFLQKQVNNLLTMPLFKLLFYRRSTQTAIRESWADVNEKITIAREMPREDESPADFLRRTWFGSLYTAGVSYLRRRRRAKQNTTKTSNKAK